MPSFRYHMINKFDEVLTKEFIKQITYGADDSYNIDTIELYDYSRNTVNAVISYTDLKNYRKAQLRTTISFMNREMYLTIQGNSSITSAKPKHKTLDDTLVPIMAKDDLENIAAEFLEKYHPQALRTPMYIDPHIISKKMGVDFKQVDDMKELGRIMIAGDSIILNNKEYTTSKDVILINKKLNDGKSKYSVNNTMIHECLHLEYHYKVLAFSTLCKEKIPNLSLIEWQARSLTPKIQMPKKMFIQKANELINEQKKYILDYEPYMACDYMEKIICELSEFFKVSKLSAKIRLYELGFDGVIGTGIYIDGKVVAPHYYKATKSNITYSISKQDLLDIIKGNSKLNDLVVNGVFLFVDSHLVYNDSKYVKIKNKELTLTDYARYHLDECAIPFVLKVDMEVDSYDYEKDFYFLNRCENTPVVFTVTFKEELTDQEKFQKQMELAREHAKLLESLPHNFYGAMQICLEWSGKMQTDIAKETGIGEKAVGRIINQHCRPKVKNICLICLALGLPPAVSRLLIELSGNTLRTCNDEHVQLQFYLDYMFLRPIGEIMKELKAIGIAKIE